MGPGAPYVGAGESVKGNRLPLHSATTGEPWP